MLQNQICISSGSSQIFQKCCQEICLRRRSRLQHPKSLQPASPAISQHTQSPGRTSSWWRSWDYGILQHLGEQHLWESPVKAIPEPGMNMASLVTTVSCTPHMTSGPRSRHGNRRVASRNTLNHLQRLWTKAPISMAFLKHVAPADNLHIKLSGGFWNSICIIFGRICIMYVTSFYTVNHQIIVRIHKDAASDWWQPTLQFCVRSQQTLWSAVPVGRIINSWHANPQNPKISKHIQHCLQMSANVCSFQVSNEGSLCKGSSESAKARFPAWLPPLMTLKEGTSVNW